MSCFGEDKTPSASRCLTAMCANLIRRFAWQAELILLCLVSAAPGFAQQSTQADAAVTALHQAFAHPPDDSKIMMRWWWFGPSATKAELKRELEEMKAAGIGGVEIATLYPLALDDPATGFHNYPYLSDEHIDDLRFAADRK